MDAVSQKPEPAVPPAINPLTLYLLQAPIIPLIFRLSVRRSFARPAGEGANWKRR